MFLSGRKKLNISEDSVIRCVLESDGTSVEDEEYWECLDDNTVLMLLQEQQQWLHFTQSKLILTLAS